ncbi:hypothetical protein [Pikeienuella sp. HZG-20]|uniref:hypothetical protein n=1 Tax=Paludibacillus litoralis TaxID=3133267 RepID=UPI0030EC8AFE
MTTSLRGRIAVIGWGSLLWDLDDLAPKVKGPWLMRAGPALPFEFSRISPKRKLALALCLDPAHGALCPTNAILSLRSDIHEAAEDLRARERAADIGFIGAFCARTGFRRSRLPDVAALFSEWCAATGAAGAVWTDLDSNFEAVRGAPFSCDAAIAYLRGLRGESLEEALRYVSLAPETTETPLRRALDADPWWTGEIAARRRTG